MSSAPPRVDTRPRTAVLLQQNGMGDLVWHAEYLRLIAGTSSDGQVTLIAAPSVMARELIGHEPWLREVVDFDRRPRRSERRRGRHSGLAGLLRFAAQLASERFERLVLFSDHPARALFVAWRAGIRTRLGYGATWLQRWMLTPSPWIRLYEGPAVASYKDASAFAIAQGWCDAPVVPRLSVRPDALARMQARLAPLPRPLHALAIGASEPFKQWGEAQFVELATLFAARGHGVLLLAGPAEAALARSILARIPAPLRAHVATMTDGTVADSVAALSLVQSCIGNDTGAVQIAAAVGTPTFVVLGPRPPLEHDPQTMRLVQAASLHDIRASDVAAQALRELGLA
ncbi:glycosyltransferase family 9 protein [Scleromatobacter humisilvae]|uniref:Glycosyltransferase family 9 protein n=1 Tax=Scleromatobacter humisilvae TaxID=2897159 RepID=A0A9X1YJJ3_9BURK|nr:glycosyltransferase family 9 protein [Scleromatobacter humisilvae]MCK9687086.1 glycosyltransferase family 9 protein [Scleromatobacter humisilvae]